MIKRKKMNFSKQSKKENKKKKERNKETNKRTKKMSTKKSAESLASKDKKVKVLHSTVIITLNMLGLGVCRIEPRSSRTVVVYVTMCATPHPHN